MLTRADRLLRCVRRIASQAGPEPDDSGLLTRFVTARDPVAFEALVTRHGPMVLRVCRHLLGNRHDAEDAFQATFLVLARKAARIHPPGALAGWLHGVAYHVALGARTATLRRRHDGLAPDLAPPDPRPDPLAALTAREAMGILEEEVQRLPEAYRLPVVLCCLQGLSQDEAARQLGWTAGSVKGRLERGRKRLHRRLVGRGLGLAAALALVEISRATAAGPARALAAPTAKAAVAFASRSPARAALVSAQVTALAEAGLKHAAPTRMKFGLLLLLAVGAVTAGLGLGTTAQRLPAGEPPGARPAEETGQSARRERPSEPSNEKEPARTDRRGDPLPEGAVQRFGSARLRHGGSIRTSVLSPDGKSLATAGDHSVIVWDLEKGRLLRRFPCDGASTFVRPGLTFSPDGTRLGYVRGNFFACVWDVRTGKELRRFERQFNHGIDKFWSNCCRFAKGGQEFTIVSRAAIETWEVSSGQQTSSVPVKGWVAVISPDGKTYFHPEGPAGLSLGDTGTGRELTRWEVTVRREGSLACSADGKSVAVVHEDKEVQVRQAAGGKLLASFPLPESAQRPLEDNQKYWEYRVTFSADGKMLLLGTYGGLIHRWDLTAGKELPPLSKHHCTVTGMYTLPDGRTLVSTGEDGVIRRWDLKTGREEIEPASYEGHSKGVYSPDGRFVAVGDARGRIDLWDGWDGKLVRTLQQEGAAVAHLAFAPDGKLLAAAQRSGTVKFWQVPSGQPGDEWRHEPVRGEWYCDGIHFSPDGRRLCVSDYPRQTRVVEVAGGKLLWTGPNSYASAFSPDGAALLVALAGPNLTTLDAATGKKGPKVKLNLDISDGLGVSYQFAFSPDGRRLALAVEGGTLMLCDGRTCAETQRLVNGDGLAGREEKVLFGGKPTNQVRALAFSPDGKWLASAGSDTIVTVWEAATGKEVLRLAGHDAAVSSLAFSPDGRKLFSYGADGQGYLWGLKPKPAAGRQATRKELWTNLAGTDASQAHRAVRTLSEDPGSVEFLRQHLVPAARPDGARVAKLIADLDNDDFDVREEGGRGLEQLEALAEAPLREALARRLPPEAQRRAEALLGALSAGVAPTVLRAGRAVAALEYIATPEARQLLETLAKGVPEARLTQEAKAALERLSRGRALKP
jgi:RNA polymerase sigma factor (sigma-70 family)